MIETSPETGELFKALAAAQADMLPAVKDGKNPHFRKTYATISSILEAILPAFNAHGLAMTQHPGMDGSTVHIVTLITHPSGQWMRSVASAPIGKRQDAQAVGSAITYLRRYAAQSIAGLPVEDDDGHSASVNRTARRDSLVPQVAAPSMTFEEFQRRLELMELTVRDMDVWCEAHSQPAPKNRPSSRLLKMVRWLENGNAAKVRQWFQDRADG
jgi:hypothetical protein